MDIEIIQRRVNELKTPWIKSLHAFPGVPDDFRPWESGLSPSALYNCSVSCRKNMKIKTPEVKWMSIKRWVSTTPLGINLPPGVFLSIKRKESFVASPVARLEKRDFILVMFPYGNVWSMREPDVPIDEEWLWSDVGNEMIFNLLLEKDAARPIIGYYKSCLEFMEKHPEQIGIHLKRKRKNPNESLSI